MEGRHGEAENEVPAVVWPAPVLYKHDVNADAERLLSSLLPRIGSSHQRVVVRLCKAHSLAVLAGSD